MTPSRSRPISISKGSRATSTTTLSPSTRLCKGISRSSGCRMAATLSPATRIVRRFTKTLGRSARTRRSSSSRNSATRPLYDHHTTSLVFNDAPLHTRVRKLIVAALTSRAGCLHGAGVDQARRRAARWHGRQGAERSGCRHHRGLRLGHPNRDHRQSSRRATGSARPVARLVSRNSWRARAAARRRSSSMRAIAPLPSSWLILEVLVADRRKNSRRPGNRCADTSDLRGGRGRKTSAP